MKKRTLLIALVILLSMGTVVQTEIHAEAAATTVTAVGVAKAVLVLLAIAGVGISAGYAWDNAEQIKDSVVSGFTTWLQNHDPEFYTAFMLAGTNIAAGRVVNTYDALFFGKLKQYTREFFGTNTSVETNVGTTSFNVNTLAFVPNGTQYITAYNSQKSYSGMYTYPVLPIFFTDTGGSQFCFFLPTSTNNLTTSAEYYLQQYSWGEFANLTYGGKTFSIRYWLMGNGESNITFFNPKIVSPTGEASRRATAQTIATKYYSGDYANVTEDVAMKPFSTVGNVAATSADASVVSAGTLASEEDDEVVIDGDRTINLSGVNIDEWLKSLSEGVTSYADAMEQIGLAAVNTQTMTLEEIQSIAEALNPAAAGTGSISGNYTVALSDLFPFCIPFDLYNIISCFNADPVAPSAEITIPVGYDGSEFTWETYTVSLSAFDPVAAVVRVLEYVAFIIGLMLVTRKLIEG